MQHPGDPRKYVEYKNVRDGRKWVKCTEKNKDGIKCSFEKRMDIFKNQIKNGNLHNCSFDGSDSVSIAPDQINFYFQNEEK